MAKAVTQRGKTDNTRNTWATVQPMSMDPRRTMVANALMTHRDRENKTLWSQVKEQPFSYKQEPVYGASTLMDEQRIQMQMDILSRDKKNLGKSLRHYRGRT